MADIDDNDTKKTLANTDANILNHGSHSLDD